MTYKAQLLSEKMQGTISDDDPLKRENKAADMQVGMGRDAREPSNSLSCFCINPVLTAIKEESDFFNTILKKEVLKDREVVNYTSGEEEVENDHKELSDSESTQSEDSNDDYISDVEMEDGQVDDILTAENAVEAEGSDTLGQYDILEDTIIDPQNQKFNSSSHHVPSGLNISWDPVALPKLPIPSILQTPRINGREVRLREAILSEADIDFYSDRLYGCWRVRNLSPLRQSWTPYETSEIF